MPPRRPREHELETLSRRAFESLMPPGWVVREIGRDYGIDLEVEIFDAGESTGMTFKVQLKASERTASGGPSRRIKMDTLLYWKGLDVPVLIAYHAVDTGITYGRWAHTVGRESGFVPDAQTTTVRFANEEILSLDLVEQRLRVDTETTRALRAGRLPQPVPVRLTASGDAVSGFTAARLAVRLRQAIRDRGLHNEILLLSPDATDVPAVEVSLTGGSNTVLRAALPSDLASIRVTLPAGLYRPVDVTGLLTDDVLVAIAVVIERTGALEVPGRLLTAAAANAALTSQPDVAASVAGVLAIQHLARPAQRLSLRLWQSDDPDDRDLGDFYYSALLHQLNGLTTGEQNELIDGMRRRAVLEQSSSQPRRAGRAFYNIAQSLNAMGRTSDALDAMDLAPKYDPGYTHRDYYFRERGGMLWDVGRYLDAADDYRRALAIGGDSGELVPLLADTLLHAGRYAESEAALASWTPSDHRLDGLGLLVRTAVAEIREVTRLDQQDRHSARGEEIAAAEGDFAALKELLVKSDALDPRLWLRLVGDSRSLSRLVIIALVALNSAHAWATATVRAYWPDDPADSRTASALVEAGNRLSGSSFVDAIEQALDEVDDEVAADIREAVYLSLERTTNESPEVTLREVFDSPDA